MRKLIFLAVLFTASLAQSQGLSKLIEKADYTFYKEKFDEAVKQYGNILENHPNNAHSQYHYWIASHLTGDRGGDINDLLKYEETKGHTDKFYNYWLGRIHLTRYEFDLAKKHFDAFLELEAFKSKEILIETQEFLAIIEQAKPYYDHPNDIELESLAAPINSKFDDVSPAFFDNHSELVFASNRSPINPDTQGPDFSIFHAMKSNAEWYEPLPLHNLGTFSANNAKVEVVNEDGKLFVFKDNGGGDLFYSEPDGTNWTSLKEFDSKIKTSLIESHFFINDQENKIFFASKRGGKGLDIYESSRDENGIWSTPSPLSDVINGEWDEDYPFLSHDGKTLYFSSNRPEALGGFDIFKSEYNNGNWSKPTNLGFPINTIDDEIHYQVNQDNISGFLSSNRLHSLGGYDIYYFHAQGKAVVQGKVTDENGKPLIGLQVRFHPVKYEDESFIAQTNKDGSYRMEIFSNEQFKTDIVYKDVAIPIGEFDSKVEGRLKLLTKDLEVTIPKDIVDHDYTKLYEGIATEQPVDIKMIGNKFRPGNKVLLNNIYFEKGEHKPRNGFENVIDRVVAIMKEYPVLKIEIAGHADPFESKSQDSIADLRAREIKKYISAKGVSNGRVVTKGYGAANPIASNDDEVEGRELNRRIELIVIE